MGKIDSYLMISVVLFSIGLLGILVRRSAILSLVGIELMLNAANINFIAFWRYSDHPAREIGAVFVVFSIAVAATEAAVGVGIILLVYRMFETVDLSEIHSLKS